MNIKFLMVYLKSRKGSFLKNIIILVFDVELFQSFFFYSENDDSAFKNLIIFLSVFGKLKTVKKRKKVFNFLNIGFSRDFNEHETKFE